MALSFRKKENLYKRVLSETDLITKNEDPALTESVKATRTNLMYSLAGVEEGKCILVTSADAAEGKTTTSINLAVSLAQTQYKVLLIDADMRRPRMHTYLGVQNNAGLANYLGGFTEEIDAIINRFEDTKLDYITAGEMPPNPTELLGSKNMQKLMAELKERYDYVLIDTPPVNLVADAMTLSALVENVLFVLKCGNSNVYDVDKALSSLEFANAKMLGFVCIDSNKKTRKKRHTGNYYYHDPITGSEE